MARDDTTADLVRIYLQQARQCRLDPQEAKQLAWVMLEGRRMEKALQRGDYRPEHRPGLLRGVAVGKRARQRFIAAHLLLVPYCLPRHLHKGRSVADLLQDGNLGLIAAADRYNPARGEFSTWAIWWINQAMGRGIHNHARTIRLPVHIHELLGQVAKAGKDLQQLVGHEPTPEQLAEALGLEADEVQQLLQWREQARSLSDRLPFAQTGIYDADTFELGDVLSDPGPGPEEVTLQEIREETLHRLLGALPDREREVLLLKYGFRGQEMDRAEIGRLMGYHREWIRKLEIRALNRLRNHPDSPNMMG